MNLYDVSLPHRSLIHEIWDLCDTDINGYPLKDVVRRINGSLEELTAIIINADGTWQFDDTNYSDAPRGKGTLVEGREYYTFASEYLQIESIDILDLNNLYRRIEPFDPHDLNVESPDEYWGVDSSGNPNTGFPEVYDIKGDSIRLYPAPTSSQVTLTNGIRVNFKRTIKLFTMSNSTTITSGEEDDEPGIPSPFHFLIAYMAAVPYCLKYKKDRVADYERKIGDKNSGMIKLLIEHYAFKEKNRRAIIRFKQRSFR